MRLIPRLCLAAALGTVSLPALAAGNLVVGVPDNLTGLDPADVNDTLSQSAGRLMFQGLLRFDKDMKVVPALAESWDANPGATEFTFHLRHGVQFQDGTPFNAAAVKINLERIADPNNHLKRQSLLSMLDHVDVVDEYTAKVVLKTPFGAFIPTMAHPAIVMMSPKALATYGKEIGRHPVGTGPFEFVSWTPDTLKVKRNEHYWKPGLPHVDTVTFRSIPENGARIAALQAGEAQFIYPVPPELLASVSRDSRIKVINAPSIYVRYASMNTLKKPFDDVRVRQALNYAIDKAAYARVVFNGAMDPLRSPIPPGLNFYQQQGEYPYDPAKAKQLLKEAGYPDGFSTVMWGQNNTIVERTLQFLQQQLGAVGVKVEVQPLEMGLLSSKIWTVQKPEDAAIQMYTGGWSSSTGDADWGIRPLFWSKGVPPKLYNTAYYSNPDVDRDIQAGLDTTDDGKRAAAYADAQARIWKDAPWIFLGVQHNLAAESTRLSGMYIIADTGLLTEDAELH